MIVPTPWGGGVAAFDFRTHPQVSYYGNTGEIRRHCFTCLLVDTYND